MHQTLKIAIVGYGIAGIAAAIHLRRLGHKIEHVERRASTDADGAGMLLQPSALALLRDIGLGNNELELGARVHSLVAEDIHGRTLTRIHYSGHEPGGFALGVQRRYLIERLLDLDPGQERVNFMHEVESVDAERGILRFRASGDRGPYDLIIAADGANSLLRDSAPQLVLRNHLSPSAALVACIEDPNRLAGDRLVQYFYRTRHVAIWPVGSAARGEPERTNFSVNIPLAQAQAFRDSGEWKAVVIRHCPPLIPLFEELDKDFTPIIHAYRDVSLRRLSRGRLVYIGDAGHSMSPVLGQGARMALLDAATLAQALQMHDCVSKALEAHDRRMQAQIANIQRISRWLTPIFQSESSTLAAVRRVLQIAHRLPFVATRTRALLLDG